jgi:hypothetical protein
LQGGLIACNHHQQSAQTQAQGQFSIILGEAVLQSDLARLKQNFCLQIARTAVCSRTGWAAAATTDQQQDQRIQGHAREKHRSNSPETTRELKRDCNLGAFNLDMRSSLAVFQSNSSKTTINPHLVSFILFITRDTACNNGHNTACDNEHHQLEKLSQAEQGGQVVSAANT